MPPWLRKWSYTARAGGAGGRGGRNMPEELQNVWTDLGPAWPLVSPQRLSHVLGILGKQPQAVATLLCLLVLLPVGSGEALGKNYQFEFISGILTCADQ